MRETVPREALLDDLVREADRLEDLRADVGGDRRDAHLRHRLEKALAHRLDVVIASIGLAQALRQQLAQPHVLDRLEGHVGLTAEAPKPRRQAKWVHLARLAGLDDEAAPRAEALADQVMVDGGDGEERRDRRMIRVHRAIGEDEHLVAVETYSSASFRRRSRARCIRPGSALSRSRGSWPGSADGPPTAAARGPRW